MLRRARSAAVVLLALGSAAWLAACTSAARRLDLHADAAGLEVLTLPAGGFRLRAYGQRLPAAAADVLHVYLEGDGRPWVAGGTRVAHDPHGLHHLAFDLMRLDPAPSLYLKRPCYQGLEDEGPCRPLLWTHERYSETVVDAMDAALRSLLASRPARRIVWIGYSGGGVLAMLLAPRFEQTASVVTIAANLDVAAWAERHRYTPLAGSLDPALRPPLGPEVRQLHLVGELDHNVPPALVRAAVAGQPAPEVRVVPGFDHTCCWHLVWPGVLSELDPSDGPDSGHR